MSTPNPLASLPGIYFTDSDVPSVSVAALSGTDLFTIASKGVLADTLFQACSISKPVAALAVLALVAQDLIELDDDVNQHLTSWRLPVSPDWPVRVTVRQLLCHGGAISVRSFPGYPQKTALPSLTDILNGTGHCQTPAIRVTGLPGVSHRYSGGGYTVLQQLIEDVTGTTFAQAVTDLVLTPLRMTGARYTAPPKTQVAPGWMARNPPLRAKARQVPDGWLVFPELAAAGLWCTPTDLVKFGRAIQDMTVQPGSGRGAYPLRKYLARLMLAEELPGWGLGVELAGAGTTASFWHGGDNEGYSCMLSATVAPGPVIAIMTASNVGKKVHKPLMDHIRPLVGWPGATAPTSSAPVTVTQMPSQDEMGMLPVAYGGSYRLPSGQQLTLAGNGWNWTLSLPGQPLLPLEPKSETWVVCPVLPIEITFRVDPGTGLATGLSLRMIGDQGPETLDASRV